MLSSQPHLRALLVFPKLNLGYFDMEFVCELKECKSLTPPLGLLTTAALLPQEWQLRLVDENVEPLTEAHWDWADVVLFSALLIQRGRLIELLGEAKARGKTAVVGGPYPTLVPETMLAEGADIVVLGELENLVAPLLAALEAGHTGVVLEAKEKPDLTTSPIPRFDLLRLQEYGTLAIQTSRGCPFDCEFCDVVRIFGRKPRHKTPEQVVAELETLYRLGWRGDIFVSDDNFIGTRSFARDLLKLMIPWHQSRGAPFDFTTQVSVDLGQDRELIDLMTQANFSRVLIGVESPDEEVLKFIHKHQNVRYPLVESLNNITANGLSIIGTFILGFDKETSGAGERIAALVEATNLPYLLLFLLAPFPHTRLWERLKREGRLHTDFLTENLHDDKPFFGQLAFQPTRPETEILSEYLELWERLYDRSNFLSRALRYYLAMRPTRRALAQAQGKAASPSPAKKSPSFQERFQGFKNFLKISWAYCQKPACRRQYFRQLLHLKRHNPSRLVPYLTTCALAEDMISLREVVSQHLRPLLGQSSQGGASAG